ncbi:hypothetical protein [Bacillus sp. B-jedd]|uniref:hypothetical protein n=1 Tax=Bacillus sp. B-jedd TaxID=1476857 RepID=UPI0005156400|nr:hypothetical protein [Bacillus sp. B-jedd]CEG27212.1 hypothetical protein BN1002_02068 [Bacillus sp. B-jedd]
MKLKYKLLIIGVIGGILGSLSMLMISKYSTAYYLEHININIAPKDTSLLTLLFMSHIFLGIVFAGAVGIIAERLLKNQNGNVRV